MDRRVATRHPRHLQVIFRKAGEDQPLTGFTTNISSTGMFISTGQVLPSGTRLRLEIKTRQSGFVAEGVVARSIRAPRELAKLKQSGMGVRFLTIEELVKELIPTTATHTADAGPAKDFFEVIFPSPEAFRRAFERDIATGGLYVPSPHPAALHAKVSIGIGVRGASAPPVVLPARVVQCFDPELGEVGGANLISGMGVEFVDQKAAMERLGRWLETI